MTEAHPTLTSAPAAATAIAERRCKARSAVSDRSRIAATITTGIASKRRSREQRRDGAPRGWTRGPVEPAGGWGRAGRARRGEGEGDARLTPVIGSPSGRLEPE